MNYRIPHKTMRAFFVPAGKEDLTFSISDAINACRYVLHSLVHDFNKLSVVQRETFFKVMLRASEKNNILSPEDLSVGTFQPDMALWGRLGLLEPCDEGGNPLPQEIVAQRAAEGRTETSRFPPKMVKGAQEAVKRLEQQIEKLWYTFMKAKAEADGRESKNLKLTPKKRKLAREKLRHYSYETLQKAILGQFMDEWTMKNNKASFEWALATTDTYNNIEKFSEIYEEEMKE